MKKETRGRKKKVHKPLDVTINKRTGLPNPTPQVKKYKEGVAEWNRVCKLLKDNNLIADLYFPTLEMYCYAHAQLVKCSDVLDDVDPTDAKLYGDCQQNVRRWMQTKTEYLRALGMSPRDIQKVRQAENNDNTDEKERFFAE